MSTFFKQINGVFTINIEDKEYPNLVVATGLSSIFGESQITSLCDTLKVFNDDTEVNFEDTDYLSPVATSSNVTDTQFGVSGDGITDYFFMKKTWTFFQGQIKGVINKLAVFSDDGSLYAAALLKNEQGELDPVRPLFAPKVEITYESRWHFKQDTNYTVGNPVYFSEAGMVTVKTNMADKNNPVTYENMNKPFRILDVELFSDSITTNDAVPTQTLGKLDVADYTIQFVNGDFNAYGQYLNILLPKDKYISDTPIASMVITTSRGKWQVGFEAPLEKPTLSKREISLTIPFVHGIVTPSGDFELTGNPDAINSIFSSLLNATYNISIREVAYDNAGMVVAGTEGTSTPGYFAALKDTSKEISFTIPENDAVTIVAGSSTDVETYLGDLVTGIKLIFAAGQSLTGTIDDVVIENTSIEVTAGDLVSVSFANGAATVFVMSTGETYDTSNSSDIPNRPDNVFIGVLNAESNSKLTVY